MTTPFISAEDLAVYLRLDVNQNTGSLANDELAQIAIDSGCQVVRDYCDQTLSLVQDEVVTLDGTGMTVAFLPEFPIVDVTAVSVFGSDLVASSEEVLASTDWTIGPAGLLHRIDGGLFTVGKNNVSVTYSHGYATVPSAARIVALQVAARIYDIGMMQQESTGAWSGSYVQGAGSLTPFEERALYFYRRAA